MINWNLANQIVNDSFAILVDEFAATQIAEIKSVKWNWPRETKRQNGDVVFTPRDIVDTGELRDSLSIEWISDTEVIYHYDADYALYVHQGAVLESGTELPARPWIDTAQIEYDLVDNLANILEKTLENENELKK